MIYTNIKLTINENETKYDKKVVLYREDYNVEIQFDLTNNQYIVLDNTHAQLIIKISFLHS